ncbi:MAG: hypothetical protein ACXIVD_18200 [Salinarimonas sp.]
MSGNQFNPLHALGGYAAITQAQAWAGGFGLPPAPPAPTGNQAFPPSFSASTDPGYGGNNNNIANATGSGVTYVHTGGSSGSSDWPITSGQKLTSELDPSDPNRAPLLLLKNAALDAAGADALLNRTEGGKFLKISEQQMDLIIKNLAGEDATEVSVQAIMEHFEQYADDHPQQKITNAGINQATIDMMGGINSFSIWSGDDEYINRNEFYNLVQALISGTNYSISRAQSDHIHSDIAGADHLMSRNEFNHITEVQADGTFDWDEAQTKIVALAAAVGPIPSNNQVAGNTGNSFGLSGAHPTGNNTFTGVDNNSGGTGTNII